MEEKNKLLSYEAPRITVTRFTAGDCISTSDLDFGNDESWNENMPGGGWT